MGAEKKADSAGGKASGVNLELKDQLKAHEPKNCLKDKLAFPVPATPRDLSRHGHGI